VVTLRLLVAHDGTPIQKTICNDNYKFATFSHSILHEFAVVNKVTSIFYFELVMTLHS